MAQTLPGEIWSAAHRAGIHVRTWSPGDNVTRYRFLSAATPELERDYFAARQSYVIGTALGRKQALAWLEGFRAGQQEELEVQEGR